MYMMTKVNQMTDIIILSNERIFPKIYNEAFASGYRKW